MGQRRLLQTGGQESLARFLREAFNTIENRFTCRTYETTAKSERKAGNNRGKVAARSSLGGGADRMEPSSRVTVPGG